MMNKTIYAILFLCLAASVLAAVTPGEKLTFNVKYAGISAGKADITFSESTLQDTIPVFEIVSKARTNSFFDTFYKVRDEITSVWDARTQVTHKFSKNLHEGSYRQLRIHFYYPEQGFTIYNRYDFKKQTMKEQRMEMPEDTQDILSSLYWVRMKDFVPGDTLYVNVVADGRSYRATVQVHKYETIDTMFGEKQCILIEPLLEGDAIFKQSGRIEIWLTDDAFKIPVQVRSKIGMWNFYAILEDAKNTGY